MKDRSTETLLSLGVRNVCRLEEPLERLVLVLFDHSPMVEHLGLKMNVKRVEIAIVTKNSIPAKI